MLTLDEARRAILERIVPAHATETIALDRACGRYCAETLAARTDNPAFDNSAMDGYALRADDLKAHGAALPLKGEARTGQAPGVLAPGTCMRIFTGAPLPQGADAVAMQEDVRIDGGNVVFPPDLRGGASVRRRGEDFRRGDVLYARGQRLRAYDVALLAAAGVSRFDVFKPARVRVVATGDELVAPGEALRPGQVYESNRLATLARLEALGAEALDGGTVKDEPRHLRALLEKAQDADFIITSGGASVGDYDIVKQVFAEIGEIHFWKVRIKPGKPLAFGRIGARTHFFALPGNPVSSLVTFKLFVEPALAAWYGGTYDEPMLTATAANAFARASGRTEFLRARLYSQDGVMKVEALPGQGSHMLAPIRHTNALIRVEADSSGFAAGDLVPVMPLG